jgi:bla regulator protein blaR1
MIPADFSPFENHLWQSSLCTAGVWLLTLVLKNNRAAVRYWLWLAASIKFLVPFSLLVSVGGQFGWRSAPAITQRQLSFVMSELSQPFAPSTEIVQLTSAPLGSSEIPMILFGLWLCGFIFGLIFWLRSLRKIRAVWLAATPLNLKLPIPVLSSVTRMEPGVFGILKPVVILPAGITERLTPAQLETVIAHELCHVERKDNLTATIHMLVETIFWFHPLVWWIRTQLVAERERACDEEVVKVATDPWVYAEAILSVCKLYLEAPLACISGVTGANLKKRVEAIIANRTMLKLSFGRKLLLAAGGMAMTVLPIVIGLVNVPVSRAQASGPRAKFEVASIKQSNSADRRPLLRVLPGGRFTAANVTVRMLLRQAFDIKDFQISNGPTWIGSELFDVDAKSESSSDDPGQFPLMLQSLLADRFHLVIRRDTKELPVYALVVASKGPKFRDAQQSDPNIVDLSKRSDLTAGGARPRFTIIRRGRFTAQGTNMEQFVSQLSNFLGRTVIDKTGLTGTSYDLKLEWKPDENQAAMFSSIGVPEGFGAPPPDWEGPTLFTALEEQLGLKLVSQKGPVEMFVIERIEKPTPN